MDYTVREREREWRECYTNFTEGPTLTIQTTEVYTSVGQPTVLLCEAGGTPAPEIHWSKEGMVLEEPDYIKLNNGSLHISSTRLRDQGHFIVRAANSVGTVEEVVRVVVLAPSPPESKCFCLLL